MLEKELKVWIGSPQGVSPVFNLSQYDDIWQFIFSVYNGDEVWTIPSGAEVILNGRKPDGTVFTYVGAVEDANVIVNCGKQMTSAKGKVICELRFSVDGEIVGTANFTLNVEAAPLTGYVISEDDFSAINQLVNKALTAASSAGSAADAMAAVKAAISTPNRASTIAEMNNDNTKVYIYVGTESGMVAGHLYYYDGSDWVDAGAPVVTTDKTFSQPNQAADAKAVGDNTIRRHATMITTASGLSTITSGTKNANDLPVNKLVVFSLVATAMADSENFPLDSNGGFNGSVLTLSHNLTAGSAGEIQICVKTSAILSRRRTSSAWGAWKQYVSTDGLETAIAALDIPVIDALLENAGEAADAKATGDALATKIGMRSTMVTSATGLNAVTNDTLDFDNLITNTYVVISVNNLSNVLHSPTGTGTVNGTVINLSLDGTVDRNGNIQVYFASSSIRIRRKASNTWGDWKIYATTDYVDEAIAALDVPTVEKYYVGASRENKSFVGLLLDLKDVSNEKIIYLDAGTYDIFAEYLAEVQAGRLTVPADTITSSDYMYPYNAFVPPNTKIVGRGKVVLDFSPTAEEITYGESVTWSPLNVMDNIEVENITIVCKNGRYCIHDDSHNASPNTKHVYRNVHCIYTDGDSKTVGGETKKLGFSNTIGFGFSAGSDFIFENCIFEYIGSGDHGVFYGHNHTVTGGSSANITVKDSIIKSTDSTNKRVVRLQTLSRESASYVQTLFSNCYIAGEIQYALYYSDSIQAFDVDLLNCGNIATNIVRASGNVSENPYPAVIYNS